MCASDYSKMDPEVISRFNSTSTSKTLVGSDDGLVSPTATPLSIINEKLQAAGPIIQTKDNRQWIDLDSISPKLLKELRRQYDVSEDEKKPFSKGAARIKAWTRQTKLGFDIRLRRKISPEHDEITDFSLVRDPMPMTDAKTSPVPEMPENAVFELPDNSIVPELSAIRTEQNYARDEPLPRYEPPPGDITATGRPQLSLDTYGLASDYGSPQRSPSESSIVATPTRGLSLIEVKEGEGNSRSDNTCDDEFGEHDALHPNLGTTADQLQREGDEKKDLQALLKILQDQLSTQTIREASKGLERLKLAETKRYDVGTDAEPEEGAQTQTPTKRKRRLSARGRKKRSAKLQSPSKRNCEDSDDDDEVGIAAGDLPRRLTLPKRLQASDGPEAVWRAVLKAQAKILGAEHPLIWSSKHAMSLSRVQHHQNCSPDLLSALRESETTAIQTLGKVHPLVEAFSADLRTLEMLILENAHMEDERQVPTPQTKSAPRSPSRLLREEAVPEPRSPTEDSSTQAESPSPTRPWDSLPVIKTTFHSGHNEPSVQQDQPQVGRDSLWNTYRPPHEPPNDFVVLSRLAFTAVTSTLKNGLSWLERTYGPEPAVEPGKVRVRWTCSCGSSLYDDFFERRPGAARELEAYLNRPRTRTGGTPTSPSSSRSYSGSFNSSVGGTFSTNTSSINTSWSNYSQASHGSLPGEKQQSQTASTVSQYSSFVPIAEPPWLLVCTNEDRFTPKVTHVDVAQHKITSDKELAKALREHYFEVNRKWWRKLRLRGLTTIEFVQFECHQNRFADIRKCPDMPPAGKSDYSFEPSELIPPVGNAYLKHLFNHPEDYDGELITYLRAPKKISRLQLGVGWGINMVEGFLADRIWLCVNVVFALVSVVFGIAWACERNDIQGAFGVAQWICTLAVFAGGWLQAWIG